MNRVKSANAFKPAARMARTACGLAVSIFAMLGSLCPGEESALGNGQSLQRNLHRFNQSLPGRDPLAASRYQNSIVNGNAPSGQSFRGNLGYRNSSDFQGKLGSDDLFNFSRDSSFSGLAGRSIRGSQLNDYQGARARRARALGIAGWSVRRPASGDQLQQIEPDYLFLTERRPARHVRCGVARELEA